MDFSRDLRSGGSHRARGFDMSNSNTANNSNSSSGSSNGGGFSLDAASWPRRYPPQPNYLPLHDPPEGNTAGKPASSAGRTSADRSRMAAPVLTAVGDDAFYALSPAPDHRRSEGRLSRATPSLAASSTALPLYEEDGQRPYRSTQKRQEEAAVAVEAAAVAAGGKGTNTASASHPTPGPAPLPAGGPPSIYWSDDATSISNTNAETATIASVATSTNPSAFTFFREAEDDDEDDGLSLSMTPSSPLPTSGEKKEGSGSHSSKNRRGSNNRYRLSMAAVPEGSAAAVASTPALPPPTKAPLRSNSMASLGSLASTNRNTADFEFVNGRYVPPGLRNGRMPGRQPLRDPDGKRDHTPERYQHQHRPRLQHRRGGDDDDGDTPDLGGGGLGNYVCDCACFPCLDDRGRTFWLMAVLLALAVIATAVGVGVGLGLTLTRG